MAPREQSLLLVILMLPATPTIYTTLESRLLGLMVDQKKLALVPGHLIKLIFKSGRAHVQDHHSNVPLTKIQPQQVSPRAYMQSNSTSARSFSVLDP